MGGQPTKAFPTPGVVGSGLGTTGVTSSQGATASQALKPMQPLTPAKGAVPGANTMQTGRPNPPTGQTPMNPWGQNRGGSGMLPLYRRPGTMPELG